MHSALPADALDQLFRAARTHNELGGEVSDELLRQLYDLLKWGPTTANSCPARFVFVKSTEAKDKLGPALDEGNYAKTMAAPCRLPLRRQMVRRSSSGLVSNQDLASVCGNSTGDFS